jgi:amino acid permease
MFSRQELLAGLPARRASAILFAIEAHTARLMANARITRATYVSRRGAAEREHAFLEALSAGRDLPLTPAIQDLERFAPQWAHLVPEGTEARAAVAILLASKYRLPEIRTPQLQAALGVDRADVAAAIARQAPGRPIFVPSLSMTERVAWWRAGLAQRIERLPPFWIAYALALTETITEGILVVPIAVAGIGPMAGVVVLIVLGLINLVTLGALAEAITRNGSMRYGAAYFGRLVAELLGRPGSISLSVALGIFNAVVLLVYLLGFASVLWGATGIPEEIWVLLLFAVNAWVLRREVLDETVATAVVVGVTNIALILAITAIAFANVDPANLAYRNVPFLDGDGLDPVILQLVFGVIIVSYFGHTSAANASKLILGQDPSGRALLLGNLAALASVIALYCLIVVGFAGALGPEPLVGTRGTAITPLAAVAGPIIDVLGSIYVVLAVGLGSLYCSLGLYNQVIEYLPGRSERPVGGVRGFLATRPGRYLAGLAPTLAAFAILEFLLLTDQDWLARPVAIVGVLTIPLLGGIVPMLLVVAARRRGEYVPGRVIRILGNPTLAGGISVFFLIGILLHGLVIWEDPIERAAALAIAALTVGLVVSILRGPSFRRAVAIEIRDAPRGVMEPAFSVVVAGQSRPAEVTLDHDDGTSKVTGATGPVRLGSLRRATFTLAGHAARDLKVWVHRVTADGETIGIAGSVQLQGATGPPMPLSRQGTLATEIGAGPLEFTVTLEPSPASRRALP